MFGENYLIAVVKNNTFKIAQFCRDSGNPDSAGLHLIHFLRNLDKENMDKFKTNIDNCSFYDSEIPNYLDDDNDSCFVVNNILNGKSTKFHNSLEFAADSLLCKWVWLIDLDENTFECYKGMNMNALSDNSRFEFLTEKSRQLDYKYVFYPVRIYKSWKISELPTDEEFIKSF
jgi:hypothetical protein